MCFIQDKHIIILRKLFKIKGGESGPLQVNSSIKCPSSFMKMNYIKFINQGKPYTT